MSEMPKIEIELEPKSGENGEKENEDNKPKTAEEKESKSEVDYGRGTPKEHCGHCTHFEWSSFDLPVENSTCELVSGYVQADKWCKLFEPVSKKAQKTET